MTKITINVSVKAPVEKVWENWTKPEHITKWNFGELPHEVTTMRADVPVRGYPALLDDGDSVSIRVFTTPNLQAKVMRNGVRRLLLIAVPVAKRAIERDLTSGLRLAVAQSRSLTLEQLADDCLTAAADRVIADFGALPYTATDFDDLARTR